MFNNEKGKKKKIYIGGGDSKSKREKNREEDILRTACVSEKGGRFTTRVAISLGHVS